MVVVVWVPEETVAGAGAGAGDVVVVVVTGFGGTGTQEVRALGLEGYDRDDGLDSIRWW